MVHWWVFVTQVKQCAGTIIAGATQGVNTRWWHDLMRLLTPELKRVRYGRDCHQISRLRKLIHLPSEPAELQFNLLGTHCRGKLLYLLERDCGCVWYLNHMKARPTVVNARSYIRLNSSGAARCPSARPHHVQDALGCADQYLVSRHCADAITHTARIPWPMVHLGQTLRWGFEGALCNCICKIKLTILENCRAISEHVAKTTITCHEHAQIVKWGQVGMRSLMQTSHHSCHVSLWHASCLTLIVLVQEGMKSFHSRWWFRHN